MIIVTGGAGFIGSNLVAGLEQRGLGPIVVVDRLRQGDKWRNIAKRNLHDLVTPEQLPEFLDRHGDAVKVIFHMGAISATTETDADRVVENNFRLTLDLWSWCAATGVRLIYASSAATYGDGAQGFDDDSSAGALARLRPLNPYGWSKHLLDRRVRAAIDQRAPTPPQHVGLKFFNVYGPNEYHKGGMRSVPAKLYPQIMGGEPARLFASDRPDYADGGQLRDFVWVGDTVDVMLWLYDNPGVSGLFNLGTGKARSWNDLAHALFAAAGLPPRIDYIPMPDTLKGKYQYYTQADMGRLRAAGYDRPFTELGEGIRRYVQDHMGTADPYV
ncbi:ADP-glyceromanno-heptose 6-epimerase precursor [Nitrospirillum amazonense]|uniref:ADP-L-glycero-D-manno-heptose-6-epimerase n=1 Tax=Nitrospirillum amazonense TaxID=28077 RepID=A0A560FSG8_9PROT|nr:ADP-glyceromanno-heptose 6-epimerase [Nitrospirillum amazonense]TWB24585.1 ADP-glyceromanno-heptose 6-epimerase precursor [Nitrospirillum amazonense]